MVLTCKTLTGFWAAIMCRFVPEGHLNGSGLKLQDREGVVAFKENLRLNPKGNRNFSGNYGFHLSYYACKGGENLTRSLRSVAKNWLLISSPGVVSLLIHYSTDNMSLHISPNVLNSNISCFGIFPNWYLSRQLLLMSLLSVFFFFFLNCGRFYSCPPSRFNTLSKPL